MGQLFEKIRQAIDQERYIIGLHASERLEERRITEWQVVLGMSTAKLMSERASDIPNPSIEATVELSDGTEVKAVWSWLRVSNVAKLVTVHFFDEL